MKRILDFGGPLDSLETMYTHHRTIPSRFNSILRSKESLSLTHNELVVRNTDSSHDSRPVEIARRLGDDNDKEPAKCDSAFMACLGKDHCVKCYTELNTKEIDWTSVSQDTECLDVMKVLYTQGHCLSLKNDKPGEDLFCSTFKTCITIPDTKKKDDDKKEDTDVDCAKLTACDWPGFHPSFLGDGVCHENMGGCYNTKICGWDGGDCCKDTCESKGKYLECGHDGYACRDPESKNCDSKIAGPVCNDDIVDNDDNKNDDGVDPASIECSPDSTLYRLEMYDSFGDGWEETKLTIVPKDDAQNTLFEGGLEGGSKGTEYICLSRTKKCYDIELSGGIWGNEVSWEIKPSFNEGAPSIASGGAPMDCQFGVAGADCKDNCDGKSNRKSDDDPDYKEFKSLFKCMDEKCPIQVGICKEDALCDECFVEDAPDFCFAVDTFNAVITCAMCQCTDSKDSMFCDHKMSPGIVIPTEKGSNKRTCSPQETLKGAQSVVKFGECTDLEKFSVMVTEFDQNNFGPLDTFEFCAHAFSTQPNHGGHTALGCLRILVNAMDGIMDDDYNKDENTSSESIAALAGSIYNDNESFCDCAKDASDQCPLCESFLNFKTLLYESLDACQALDEIDCDAWDEFHKPCKKNLESEFGKVDFSKEKQCKYVKSNCGGAGPFPVFRRLDCGEELSSTAWDFYTDFAGSCLKSDKSAPKPAPSSTPAPSAKADSSDDDVSPAPPSKKKKPYVPPEDRDKKDKKKDPDVPPENLDGDDDAAAPADDTDSDEKQKYNSAGKKKSSHWFRNFVMLCLIGGGGYYYYKRQSEGFSFVRHRRFRNFGGGFGGFGGGGASNPLDDGMYSGLAMESSYTGSGMESSVSFEPPTLPPMPSAIDDNYGA